MNTESSKKPTEQYLDDVLKALPNPIAVLDGQGQVLYANPAFTAITSGSQARDVSRGLKKVPGFENFFKDSLEQFRLGTLPQARWEVKGEDSPAASQYLLQPLPSNRYLLRVESLESSVTEQVVDFHPYVGGPEFQSLLATLDPHKSAQEILNQLLAFVMSSLGAQGGAVSRIDVEHQQSRIEAGSDMPEGYLNQAAFPLENSVLRWTARGREPVMISDLRSIWQQAGDEGESPAWQAGLLEHYSAVLAVPLVVDQVLFGALELYYGTKPEFTQDQIRQAGDYANLVKWGIEFAQLEAAESRLGRELSALYRADSELYQQFRLAEILQAIVDLAVEILEADKSSLFVWDAHRERLEVVAAHGFKPETLKRMILRPDEGVIGLVALSGEVAVVSDVRQNPRVNRSIADAEGIESFIHVPIMVGGRVFGVFNIDYMAPHTFSEDERRLFTALAQRASMAIESANLHQLLDARNSLIETILSSTADAPALDQERIFETLSKSLIDLSQAKSCWIYLIDHSEANLLLWESHLSPAETAVNHPKRKVALAQNPLLYRIIQNHEPYIAYARDQKSGLETDLRRMYKGAGLLCVPVLVGNQTTALALLQRDAAENFSEQQLVTVHGMTSIAGLALENLRLRQQNYSRADEVRTVLHILGAISRRLDAASLLHLIADHARRLSGGDGAFITLLQDGKHQIFAASSGEGLLQQNQTLAINDPNLVSAILSPHATLLTKSDPVHQTFLADNGLAEVQSIVLLPIATLINPLGALWVYSTQATTMHTESERVLAPLAACAYITLEIDRLSRA